MAIADLIQSLATHEVEFIIVGGVAALLQGAPINTIDLDIVYARTPANIDRALEALVELGLSIETTGGGCLQLALTSKAPVTNYSRRATALSTCPER